MSDDLITVYLTREYRFEGWVWHTGMTADQLWVFWKNIEDFWTYTNQDSALCPPGPPRSA